MRGNVEALTLWFVFFCLLFMAAVVLSRPVAAERLGGEIRMISRYDCSVWASKNCGELGLKSVYGYNVEGKVCVWGCAPTVRQRMVYAFMVDRIRLFNKYSLGGFRNGLD